MIRQQPTKSITPNHFKVRSRYRGPIESNKIIGTNSTLVDDIHKLSDIFDSCIKDINQLISESVYGSDYEVEVCTSGKVLFQCNDNEQIHKIHTNPLSTIQTVKNISLFVDGKLYKKVSAEVGDVIELEDPPKKEGYNFIRWEVL